MVFLDVYITNRYYGNILNILQNEIIYGGYFAALCSPAFIITSSFLINIKLDLPILLIAYLLPLIIYSYDYYKDIDKDIAINSKRATFLKNKAKKYPIILSLYIGFLALMLVLFSNYSLIIFILALIFIGILYNIALKDLTKKIPVFKNIYTSLTWALGGAFFPLLYYSLNVNFSFIMVFLLIFFRCTFNVMFFDLKDIENDKKEGLKTIPTILGKKGAIKFLYVFNIITFIPLIWGVYTKSIPLFALTLIGFAFYGFYYIKKAENATSNEVETVSHTLADFEFILWPMVLLIAQFIF